MRAVRAHGGDQLARARRQFGRLPGPLQRGDIEARQHADPLDQRGAEIELAVHRTPGDLGDLRLQPGEGGDLVQRLAVTMVLSMSASSSRLRRPAAGVARTSTGAPSSAVVARRSPARRPAREGDVGGFLRREPVRRAGLGAERLQRGADAEQGGWPSPPGGRRGSGYGTCGAPYGEACSMTQSRGDAALPMGLPRALIVAGPTASGKSALALDLARAARRRGDQRRFHAGLSRTAGADGAADAGGGGARAAPPLWRAPGGGGGQRRLVAGAALAEMAAARAAGRLPILCGGTGLYFLSLTEGLSAPPPVPAEARAEARALLAERGAAALHARLAAADPTTAARSAPATASGWRGPGRSGPGRGRGWPPGSGRARIPARRHGTSPPSCWTRRARRCAPPSPPGSTPCWPAARWRRSGRWARSAWTRPCRRCGRMACRNCWPICAGAMTLEAARERAVLNTGQYTKRQATWFRHHAPWADPSLTHIIHARMGGQTQFQESMRRKFRFSSSRALTRCSKRRNPPALAAAGHLSWPRRQYPRKTPCPPPCRPRPRPAP